MLEVTEWSEEQIKYPVGRRDPESGFIVLFFLKTMELLFLLLREPGSTLEKFHVIGSLVQIVKIGNP